MAPVKQRNGKAPPKRSSVRTLSTRVQSLEKDNKVLEERAEQLLELSHQVIKSSRMAPVKQRNEGVPLKRPSLGTLSTRVQSLEKYNKVLEERAEHLFDIIYEGDDETPSVRQLNNYRIEIKLLKLDVKVQHDINERQQIEIEKLKKALREKREEIAQKNVDEQRQIEARKRKRTLQEKQEEMAKRTINPMDASLKRKENQISMQIHKRPTRKSTRITLQR